MGREAGTPSIRLVLGHVPGGPGHPISRNRGAEGQVARQGLQPLSKYQAKFSQFLAYSQM
jgi:hypothetical protein